MTADALNSGREIYSNYEVFDQRYHELTPEILIDPQIHGAAILLDEAYAWLESRTSGKDINRYMSYILFQGRKSDNDFYMTEQLLSTIDLRYRDMIDYEIRCKAVPNYRHPQAFQYRIIDVLERVEYKLVLPIEEARRYFPLYNTYQRVSPIDAELMVKVSKSKTSIIETVDEIVDDILNSGSQTRITKAIVSDYCLRHNHPKSYVEMAYNALRSRMAKAQNGLLF